MPSFIMIKEIMTGTLFGFLAALLTSLWAVQCRNAETVHILEAFTLTGVAAFVAILVSGEKTPPFSIDQESLVLFLSLASYQTCLYFAFHMGSPLIQAFVNTNVAIIACYDIYKNPEKYYMPTIGVAIVFQIGLSLFIVHQSGTTKS